MPPALNIISTHESRWWRRRTKWDKVSKRMCQLNENLEKWADIRKISLEEFIFCVTSFGPRVAQIFGQTLFWVHL